MEPGCRPDGLTGGLVTAHPLVARKPAAWARLRAMARRHRAFLVVLGVAVVLRVLVMKAYRPAFWYDGDSGSYLHASAHPLTPDIHLAYGYVVFLKLFRFTHTLAAVVGVQHLLGVAVAVFAYALLQRRGVARWVSCLAVAPLLFDVVQLSIEHHILGEALYTSLLFTSIALLLWRPRPTVLICALSGLLLVAAWVVKPLALPIAAVVVAYLMFRRTGWRKWTAFMVAFAIPYLSLMVWVSGHASPYGSNNLALYSRVAGFADCERLTLTDAERALCPEPSIRGHRPDWYAWVSESPGYPYRTNRANDPILRQFAIDVIRQQPLGYLRAVGREIAPHFVDGLSPGADFNCLNGRYSLPATTQDTPDRACHPQMAAANFSARKMTTKFNPGPSLLRNALSAYSGVAHTTLPVTAAFLLTLLALLARWRAHRQPSLTATVIAHRRGPEALAADATMLIVATGAIIVLPVLVGMYEPRYALPALPFVALAIGFASRAISQSRPRPDLYGATLAVPIRPDQSPLVHADSAPRRSGLRWSTRWIGSGQWASRNEKVAAGDLAGPPTGSNLAPPAPASRSDEGDADNARRGGSG
jgi:hypothetical protein